jgi:hypothetical protein
MSQNQHSLRNEPTGKENLKSWTPEWMMRRIHDQTKEIAIRDLRIYTKRGRREEVTPALITKLNETTKEKALWYIKNLHENP